MLENTGGKYKSVNRKKLIYFDFTSLANFKSLNDKNKKYINIKLKTINVKFEDIFQFMPLLYR